MKVIKLKKEKRLDVYANRALGVQTYGKGNDYPQSVLEILAASTTGASCVDIYRKFINGKGFADENLYSLVINEKGQTADQLLRLVSKDYAEFGGFAIHVNFNLNYRISELQHVPFETVRFTNLDSNGQFNTVKTHPDWGRRNTSNIPWDKKYMEEFPLFNPGNAANEIFASKGIENYKGQIYYFSNKGDKVYPLPVFDSALTDMSTEEGLSNVSYRNVRNNFFPSAIFTEIREKDQTEEQEGETAQAIKDMQGDESLGKILYLQVSDKEEIPDLKPFPNKNYDKEFDSTRNSTKDNIGRTFAQPPILRSEDVGANFGSDLMENAYNYYNSSTEDERLVLEMEFAKILAYWFESLSVSTEIIPKSFDIKLSVREKLGDKFDKMIEIVLMEIEDVKKKKLLKTFGLSDEEIKEIL